MCSYATLMDKLLMTAGALAAIAGGFALPAFSLIMGELVDAMGPGARAHTRAHTCTHMRTHVRAPVRIRSRCCARSGVDNIDAVADEVQRNAVLFVIVAAASFVVSYVEVLCFTFSAERQVRRIREEYLGAILRQEVGWFDKHGGAELSTRLAECARACARIAHCARAQLMRACCRTVMC